MSLTRITLWHRTEFTKYKSFILDGEGTILDSYLGSNVVKINSPSLKIVINRRKERRLEPNPFLHYVNKVLEKNNLYLCEMEGSKRGRFSPNILKGTFYKLKKEDDPTTFKEAMNSDL